MSEPVFCVVPRAVVRVSGRQPLDFLHATTTQDVEGLAPMQGALACVLTDKGRVRAEARVLPMTDGTVLVDCEPACAHVFTEYLAKIAPLAGCEVTDESEAWVLTAIRGDIDAPMREHAAVERDGALVVGVAWGDAGADVLAARPMPLGAREVALPELEARRIAAGRPRYGLDVTEDLIVNETPLLERAVSATKGCYPGQESVARIANLGRARRALVGVRIDASEPPAGGTPVERDGVSVGAISSSASWDGGAVAIALVQSDLGDGSAVSVAGANGVVRAL